MEWKQVKDEIPPLKKGILLYHTSSIFDVNRCMEKVTVAYITRPYDRDKKYNENYYEYQIGNLNHNPLNEETYWMEIEPPEKRVSDVL